MKKIVISISLITLTATSLYAAYGTTDASNGQPIGSDPNQTTVRSSRGVFVEYIAETTVGGQGYVLGTYHDSGTMTYASSAGDTKVYRQDGTKKNVPSVAPIGSATVNFVGAGWTMM